MNYPKSKEILEKINKSNKILINCHRSPDLDSVASALSFRDVLLKMRKEVVIASPDPVPTAFQFLNGAQSIKSVVWENFSFSDFDLFLVLDTSDWKQAGLPRDWVCPINYLIIDHHASNTNRSQGLVTEASSVCEILFLMLKDWKVELDRDLATMIYAGIFADTGGFQYSSTTAKTHRIAAELIEMGADMKGVVFNINRRLDYNLVKLWGLVINNLKIDEKHKFSWSAVPYSEAQRFPVLGSGTSLATSMFLRTIEGVDFGVAMVEDKEGNLRVSFRSRTDIDVSPMAVELGGGGHKASAGAMVGGLRFNQAVKHVLAVARKHSKRT